MHGSVPNRLPVGSVVLGALSTFSVGWLAYYATQDALRRATIRSRRKRYPLKIRTSGVLPHKIADGRGEESSTSSHDSSSSATSFDSSLSPSTSWYGGAKGSELEAIKKRFAPLRILRRYVNPFSEWRETGIWEFAYHKLVHSMLVKPRRIAWDGGLAADLSTEKGKQRVKDLLPVQALDRDRLWGRQEGRPCADAEKSTYTWIGQSTCLIQMNGLTILTDPVFGLQPVKSIFSPNRMAPMPCTIDDLVGDRGRIDVVLISHNHFDHLDLTIIKKFSKETKWVVPKGVSSLLIANGVEADKITELAWWDKMEADVQIPARKDEEIATVDRTIEIAATPSMHWTGRSLFDVNQSLWCSYVIRVKSSDRGKNELKDRSFFFCCDTGYSPLTFSSIGRAFGPVDAAAIPIGSYKPRWFMRIQHGDPHDALRIAADLGSSKQNFATHWGTFAMSDERWDEPIADLKSALERENLPEDYLVTLPFGKTVAIE
ncbi:hypothetical protein CBS101457_005961 [Exobasidium rhododendri]|nr:hypothetical protein CBS101457_005961 [Exobasidium rhododendri]